MAGGEASAAHLVAHGLGKLEQPDGVGECRATLADPASYVLLSRAEFFHEPHVRGRLFERGEILALKVLDQRNLQDFAVVHVAHDHRHRLESRQARRAQPSLACDELEAPVALPHHQRLHDSVLPDRIGHLAQLLVIEVDTGLPRVGTKLVQWQ